jgi:hypothetical protein
VDSIVRTIYPATRIARSLRGAKMGRAYKDTGDAGEKFVAERVPCPNCAKQLQTLPASYPLFDIQCGSCLFRCQVKTTRTKLHTQIRGAGLRIMQAAQKLGSPISPIISVSNWGNDDSPSMVRFFPFIPRTHLEEHRPFKNTDPDHPRHDYRMFNYVRMDKLPSFVLDPEAKWVPAREK